MKKLVLLVGLLLAAIIAAWLLWHFVSMSSVSDARQAKTLVLATGSNELVHSITIHGSGKIDEDATITLIGNGKPYKVEQLSGDIDFEWSGDWYSTTSEVRYQPVNVRAGEVVLRYRFHPHD